MEIAPLMLKSAIFADLIFSHLKCRNLRDLPLMQMACVMVRGVSGAWVQGHHGHDGKARHGSILGQCGAVAGMRVLLRARWCGALRKPNRSGQVSNSLVSLSRAI